MTGPTLPSMQLEEGYQCSKCGARISKLEAGGTTCPHCHAIWGYKQDEFGNKTMTAAGRGLSSVGIVIGIFVLLGMVVFFALFIGIIVAIVKAASAPSRPPQPQPMQQRYY